MITCCRAWLGIIEQYFVLYLLPLLCIVRMIFTVLVCMYNVFFLYSVAVYWGSV